MLENPVFVGGSLFRHSNKMLEKPDLVGVLSEILSDAAPEEALCNIAETTVANIRSYFEKDGICDNELCYRCGNIDHCRKERKERCF